MSGSVEKIWLSVLVGVALLLSVLVYRDLADQSETQMEPDPAHEQVVVRTTMAPPQQASSTLEHLHTLISTGQIAELRTLVSTLQPAVLNQVHGGFTTVMRAASTGDTDVLTLLIESGADPTIRGSSQRTALQYAVEKNRFDAARLLLAKGVDIDGVDETHLSPLVMAIDRGFTALAYFLLESGADPNIQHVAGHTALIDAARSGDMALARALIEAGADPSASLPDGRTAADLAQQLEYFEIAVYLKALE